MSTTRLCNGCLKPIPADAPQGLCPECLVKIGLGSEPVAKSGGDGFVPPDPKELARFFPQLEIIELLGQGGMGVVYKARQAQLDRLVALKILPPASGRDPAFAERFTREARALARLGHPNIVAIHDFGRAGDYFYLIMEFVDGVNLRQLEQSRRLTPPEALVIIPKICEALQYAHEEGIVHRDIKPGNILIDKKGRVKIADFGLAKLLGKEATGARLTQSQHVMGTPHYMAPEQVEDPQSVDHRADIYSLGVVFYEMLTGELPIGRFASPSSRMRGVQLDVRLDEVVLKSLEKEPERRYQQASEVRSKLETIARTPAPEAASATPGPDVRFLGWAGFAVVVERGGERAVNWKATLVALAVTFGVLSIAFGFVSAFTGRSVPDWVGWPGVAARIAIAVLAVAWGVRRALHSKREPESLPRTPRGTVMLPSSSRQWLIARRLVFAGILVLAWCVFQTQWFAPPPRSQFGGKPAGVNQIVVRDAGPFAMIREQKAESSGVNERLYSYYIEAPAGHRVSFWIDCWRNGQPALIHGLNLAESFLPTQGESFTATAQLAFFDQRPSTNMTSWLWRLKSSSSDVSREGRMSDPFLGMNLRDSTEGRLQQWKPKSGETITLLTMRGAYKEMPGDPIAFPAEARKADRVIELKMRIDPVQPGEVTTAVQTSAALPAEIQTAKRLAEKGIYIREQKHVSNTTWDGRFYNYDVSTPANHRVNFWLECWRNGQRVILPDFDFADSVTPARGKPVTGFVGLAMWESPDRGGVNKTTWTWGLNLDAGLFSKSGSLDNPFVDMPRRDSTWGRDSTWNPQSCEEITLLMIRGDREGLSSEEIDQQAKATSSDLLIKLKARVDAIPESEMQEAPQSSSTIPPVNPQ